MRKTIDYHLKLDIDASHILDRYCQEHGLCRNRVINDAVYTFTMLQQLHKIFLQYQELGCTLEQFRADYHQYDLGHLKWLLQND